MMVSWTLSNIARFFLRVFDPLLHLVGLGVAFEVDHIVAVLLQGEDLPDGGN